MVVAVITAEAKVILRKYKPKIVAVTGSVGKTSTKDAIYTVLKDSFHVRKSEKSFNSEVGIPLTILGCANAWSDPLAWLSNIWAGLKLALFKSEYPEWLVLEVGADRPGDIEKISAWLRPDVAVYTRLSKVPVHVEFFDSPEAVIREKSFLARSLGREGVLILNADDPDVAGMADFTEAKKVKYAVGAEAALKAADLNVAYEKRGEKENPAGVKFKIQNEGEEMEVMIKGGLGKQQVYPALAAIAVGVSLGLPLASAVASLSSHESPRGRMKLIDGVKGSVVIDDTYNSSPVALHEALDTLKQLKVAGKKIAVLGDMLELGRFSLEEHKKAGEMAARSCDILYAVGVRSRQIADSALGAGMAEGSVITCDDSREAGSLLQNFVQEGDIVLVKGSQSMRMERTVEEIMLKPEDAGILLVRQEREWKEKR